MFDHYLALFTSAEDATLQKSYFYKHVEQIMSLLKSFEENRNKRMIAFIDHLGRGTSSLNALALSKTLISRMLAASTGTLVCISTS